MFNVDDEVDERALWLVAVAAVSPIGVVPQNTRKHLENCRQHLDQREHLQDLNNLIFIHPELKTIGSIS